jgi:DNA (cytosine-5)-methyltransferase 1
VNESRAVVKNPLPQEVFSSLVQGERTYQWRDDTEPLSAQEFLMILENSSTHNAALGVPKISVIDLFAGPGGLGEGFSAPVAAGGTGRFRIALSIEKDPLAHQTLELRALFRQFGHGDAPREYYEFARGQLDRAALFSSRRLNTEIRKAKAEAWRAELGTEPAESVLAKVRAVLRRGEPTVLIGGPPCQAYSLVGRARNSGNPAYDAGADGRHTLYREYLKVLAAQWPAAFIMENVKGLLSARLFGQSIFNRILEDLREPAKAIAGRHRTSAHERYQLFAISNGSAMRLEGFESEADDPSRFIVRCEQYGIPQSRHRVILLGIREDMRQRLRPETLGVATEVRAQDVIGDLPKLRSGLSDDIDTSSQWHVRQRSFLDAAWCKSADGKYRDVIDEMRQVVGGRGHERLNRGGFHVPCEPGPRAHRNWYVDKRLEGVCNHESRSHMAQDLQRYLFISSFGAVRRKSPLLSDLPAELLPKHNNVKAALHGGLFNDRFRVQLAGRPSTTITSHISKDGHYYIHPDPFQCRSLTVREAARLQTFPDNYVFCGPRTSQYHQVGNAVPPLLARQIARIVAELFK